MKAPFERRLFAGMRLITTGRIAAQSSRSRFSKADSRRRLSVAARVGRTKAARRYTLLGRVLSGDHQTDMLAETLIIENHE